MSHSTKIFLASALLLSWAFESCRVGTDKKTDQVMTYDDSNDTAITKSSDSGSKSYEAIDDKNWEELSSEDFLLDIRYASDKNFTNQKIYDCARCLLRKEVAQAIRLLDEDLNRNHRYRLKLFDCFRPKDYQQRLWDVVPNPSYVTPPSKGSMHNRGLAVDLTIVDSLGVELDMGTTYDYFGKEAHYDYTNLTQNILENRKFLRMKMEQYGFVGIRTEWWHFSYRGRNYPISNYRWSCQD